MESDHEMIRRRFRDLADQAGPLRTGSGFLRRVRRRRRIQGLSAVFACAGLVAGGVGVTSPLPGQSPTGSAAAARSHRPTYCGAPRRLIPSAPNPRSSAPPDQRVVDNALRKIEAIGGGGKDVVKGGKPPGRFAPWYGGVEISTEWRKVIVYRLPHPALDAAICGAVHDVTVEFNYAVQSAVAANRLGNQILTEIGSGHRHGFQVFEVSLPPDGRIVVGVDHPGAARKALARYGPSVVVTRARPPLPLAAW
jgi:hypothetical protein